MNSEDYIQHVNQWWWGKTITLIHKYGIASVELQFDENYPSIAFIKGLSVFESYRRKGYGTEMFQICEEIAKNEKMKFLQLSVVRTGSWLPEW